MRILMLNYEFPPLGGGAANATYYLLKEFSKYENIEIHLVTSSVGKFKVEEFSENITIHYLDIGKNDNLHYQSNLDLLTYSWKSYNYCKKLIKSQKFDIMHAFFGIPCGYIAMKLKNKFNIPYIVSLRGSDVPFYNKRFYLLDTVLFKHLSKKIWQSAKAVVANSEGLKNLAKESSKGQEISVIFNGVDINGFKPKEQLNRSESEKLILISTGRLIKRKGYEYLIKALSNLKNVELQLIGDGNLRQELENMAKRLNSNVTFLGKKEHHELPELLRNSDIFILPSLNEGMSNSILEAMACGLPVVTTKTGGTEELIKGNGFIVNKTNSDDLKKTILSYTLNKELIVQHGNKSIEIVSGMSWEVVAVKYGGLYHD